MSKHKTRLERIEDKLQPGAGQTVRVVMGWEPEEARCFIDGRPATWAEATRLTAKSATFRLAEWHEASSLP